jgi:mannan endo-1,4-beta-mannosidase
MSLLGVTLFGNTFYQDPKPEWIKIDNVAVGESPEYGYRTSNSKDIGRLLDTLYPDTRVVVVIYEWSTGNAYIKSSFKRSSSGVPLDVKFVPGFTSFIVKSRIPPFPNPPVATPPPSVPPVPSGSTGSTVPSVPFVKWNGVDFVYNGSKFVPVGFNAYWLGLTEWYTYPKKEQIEEMFIVANKLGATVIRSHSLGVSSGTPNSLRPKDNTLNPQAWDPIDYSLLMARKYNVKLIIPFTDSYNYYHGNYGDFCKTRNVEKSKFWTDPGVRNDFKDYISKWLNHQNAYTGIRYKDDPSILMLELGNELGNIRPSNNSTTIPTQEWLTDISRYIKSIDTNHFVLDPCDECLGQANNFNIVSLDVHSAHFYWEDYSRVDYGANNSAAVKKPFVIGEYNSHFNQNWYNEIERRQNVKGSIFWHIYPHENGIVGGPKILHNDGYTLHYPEDSAQLLVISNHFRRMRGLPQVGSL